MNEHSNYDFARDDAKFLKSMASAMTYNDDPNGVEKHRLNEIAMRLETKFYVPTPDQRAIEQMQPLIRLQGEMPPPARPRDNPIKQPTLNAIGMLEAAAGHMRDRAKTYDKPDGERSMGKTVESFNTITGRDLRESEGWLLMALLKMVRSEQRADPHRDSIEDLVAYAALFGEARMGGK